MTEIDQEYFKYLRQDRQSLANILNAPYVNRIWDDVVSPETEVFNGVQDLLRYADAAGAISARFVLEDDRLIFAHNGIRLFTLTDPQVEAPEEELGTLNALTSTDLWQRDATPSFVTPLRSVFQYTATPQFYDPGIWFRLRQYIVPDMLTEDAPERQLEETLFVLPFDRPDVSGKTIRNRILTQFEALRWPLLFSTHLARVEIDADGKTFSFTRESAEERETYGLVSRAILLARTKGDEKDLDHFLLYEDPENPSVQVGFQVNDGGEVNPLSEPPYFDFPTKETAQLPFVLQAPFEFDAHTGKIKADSKKNRQLDAVMSELAVRALLNLREWTELDGYALLGTDLLRSLLVSAASFPSKSEGAQPLAKTWNALRSLFREEAMLPTAAGHVRACDAYWTEIPEIFSLFSNAQLQQMTGNPDAAWIFPEDARLYKTGFLSGMKSYLEELGVHRLTEQNLLEHGRVISVGPQKPRTTSPLLLQNFIRAQDISWLHSLYAWLSATPKRREWARTAPIFLNTEKEVCPLFSSGRLNLFLPPKVGSAAPFEVIHPQLMENAQTASFLRSLGIAAPPMKDQIHKGLLPDYAAEEESPNPLADFEAFFSYYLVCPSAEMPEYMQQLRSFRFLLEDTEGASFPCARGCDLFFPDPVLRTYFSSEHDAKFVSLAVYQELLAPEQRPFLTQFLEQLGVKKLPKLSKVSFTEEEALAKGLPQPDSTRSRRYLETTIEGCTELLYAIQESRDPVRSRALWDTLRALSTHHGSLRYAVVGECDYFTDHPEIENFEPEILTKLRQTPWIILRDGSLRAPSKMVLSELPEVYRFDDPVGRQVLDFLGIPDDISDPLVAQRSGLEKVGLFCEKNRIEEDDLALLALLKQPAERKNTSSEESVPQTSPDDANAFSEEDQTPALPAPLRSIASTAWDAALEASRNPLPDPKDETAEPTQPDEAQEYEALLASAEEQTIHAIRKVSHDDVLVRTFKQTDRYSYGWLRSLLELEQTRGDRSKEENGSCINLQSVRELEDEPDMLLGELGPSGLPSQSQPVSGALLTFLQNDEKETYVIDAVQPGASGLELTLAPDQNLQEVSWEQAVRPQLLLPGCIDWAAWLRRAWEKLGLAPDFDLRSGLQTKAEFIVGAPGTGKTTRLVQRAIPTFLVSDPRARVLVLGASESSSDVLMETLLREKKADALPLEGLLRLGRGTVADADAQERYSDRTALDVGNTGSIICVSSVERFLLEALLPGAKQSKLLDFPWTHVVIDDASLVPLPQMTLLLHGLPAERFIIAGDPAQKQEFPGASAFKKENIFTMMGLDFPASSEPVDSPLDLQILSRQFRSVPSIGEVLNSHVYEGTLIHSRSEKSRKSLYLTKEVPVGPLNIVSVPFSADARSIHASRHLPSAGDYSVYMALFAFEFIQHIIESAAAGEAMDIGVFCAGDAQADLVRQLLSPIKLPAKISVDIHTPRTLIGREYALSVTLLTPPSAFRDLDDAQKEENDLLQAAASRTKDSLVLLMPQLDPDLLSPEAAQFRHLCVRNPRCLEWKAGEIEKALLGSETYIQDHTALLTPEAGALDISPQHEYLVQAGEAGFAVQIREPEKPKVKKTERKKSSAPKPKAASSKASSSPAPRRFERVHSAQYGDGIIVEKKNVNGTEILTVQFSQTRINFLEAFAFTTGALTLL